MENKRWICILLILALFNGIIVYESYGYDGALAAETTALEEITDRSENTKDSVASEENGEKTPDPEETDTPSAVSFAEEMPGWHGKGKKKYYRKDNGKKATGYQKIDGNYYFFKKKTGYALVKNWKTVLWNGKHYRFYFKKDGSREMDVSKRLSKETGVSYMLETNLTTNSVMVYAKWKTKTYSIPVKRMRCSAGMAGHRTIQGTYRLSKAGSRWHVLRYGCYGQYCSRIRGPFLFHSVVYNQMGNRYSLDVKEYKKLGKAASHGCIRLQVEDAKWIYEHANSCTAHLYDGTREKLPIPYPAKKKAGKTPDGRYYDPTDI